VSLAGGFIAISQHPRRIEQMFLLYTAGDGNARILACEVLASQARLSAYVRMFSSRTEARQHGAAGSAGALA
jgi:hypothetical protein